MKIRHVLYGAAVFAACGAVYLVWGVQDYQKLRQVHTAYYQVGTARSEVTQALADGKPVPAAARGTPETSVRSLEIFGDGRIVLTFTDEFLPGGRITMSPEGKLGPTTTWRCRAENVPERYLPKQKCEA